ncbi:MAG: iron(III) dicitrate transport protein FecA [Bacteroidetes bacterium MED-G21]|nr:MAG: iron(III) dicitrate transport protein FecA [Bacteroidetes bacterium MED-G21]
MLGLRSLYIILFCCVFTAQAQHVFKGAVVDALSSVSIPNAHVKLNDSYGVVSDENGRFELSGLSSGTYLLEVSCVGFKGFKKQINLTKKVLYFDVVLQPNVLELSQVDVLGQNERLTNITRLRSIEGTAIYASKKNEVILMESTLANKATNNSRQVYAKVPGLNIWESDGLGLQLEIGARGLSPHRTSNFNTRQNGYDISADALGYPESYYTPPSEAIQKIEIVRGAASLQYGTQFGGLLNFRLKKGVNKPLEIIARQTLGSFKLQNTFVSLGGSKGKWNYYSFYQKKSRNGWRPNSNSEAQTAFSSVQYQANDHLGFGLEFTHMDYLAQQPGGLDDATFLSKPDTSLRARNWFRVNWNIAAFTVDYKFNERTKLNSRTFGLWSSRDALGVLDHIDWPETGQQRDLLLAKFNNFGNETRLIRRYLIGESESVFLGGIRWYRGFTVKEQGLADSGSNANFSFENKLDHYGSYFEFPSLNKAVFVENLVRVNDCISITPGFRYDRIVTESDGFFHALVNDSLYYTNNCKKLERGIFLAGLGASYKCFVGGETYANFSQNYRAINFNDMQVINSNIVIDPDLEDEKGFNIDLGLRGMAWGVLEYDLSVFYLNYSNRIAYLSKYYTEDTAPTPGLLYTSYRFSTNIGDSKTLGIESYVSWNVFKSFTDIETQALNLFLNTSFQKGTYVRSDEPSIKGKRLEYNPDMNLKFGLQYQYKSFASSLLYSYTSSQFADAQNTISPTQNALFGEIPSYSVLDLSTKYEKERFIIEAGVNNLLDRSYFTRRATGYPGPGIIPSDKRNYYLSLQFKI